MKVLITGNKGFIATHLQEYLVTHFPDLQIVGFDIEDNPMDYSKEAYDVIFHLAAIARSMDCTLDPFNQAHESNVELTRTLLKHFTFGRFIYTSSCAIYGDAPGVITEVTLPNPNSIYAIQKYLSECYVNFSCSAANLPFTCLRLFNTYGPGQRQFGKYPNVIASLIKTFKSKGYVEITGDGTQTRDFVYVADVVRAIVTAALLPSPPKIVNICSGYSVSLNELATKITSNIVYIEERPFDIKHQRADNSIAKELLNWTPLSLDKGLEEVLADEGLL